MAYLGIEEQIQHVRASDPRYRMEAYFFVLEALDFTMAELGRFEAEGEERHVGARELLSGVREYAILQFGPMADMVFRHWKVYDTSDLGEIVFNMVDCGLLHSRPQDRKDDFADGFDFKEAFGVEAGTRIPWDDLCWRRAGVEF